MFGATEKKAEEIREKKLKKRKISLDELYVVEVGIELYVNYNRSKFLGDKYTLVKYHKKTYDSDSYYQDIFTGSKYYLFGAYHSNHGQQCCNCPVPIINIFKECDLKYKILGDGYITMYDAIEVMKLFTGYRNDYGSSSNPTSADETTNSEKKKHLPKSNDGKPTEGKRLNDKVYPHEPAIGREQELKSVITTLASQKKSPILVGASGTGKTTIVDELVYKIQRNEVPKFLKDKEIIELDTSSIVAGTRYVGTLEEKFRRIIDYASSHDALLFIDEIHAIYGAGATANDDNDIAEMLKKAIDRDGIRVIGTTTTEEYEKYFTNDALKRRFEPTIVKEPDDKILSMIVNQVFYNYSHDSNISVEEIEDNLGQIIDILIKATRHSCRDYRDPVSNPDLIISIIDKAFADARINDLSSLTITNIIYGINSCSRIYDSVKERIVNNLSELQPKTKKLTKSNSTIVPFTK